MTSADMEATGIVRATLSNFTASGNALWLSPIAVKEASTVSALWQFQADYEGHLWLNCL